MAAELGRLRHLWRYRGLIGTLVRFNLLLRYRGSLVGVAWSLLNPLAMILVYIMAFEHIMRIGLPNYSLFLLSGLLPWTFFSGAILSSTTCVVEAGTLIKKVRMPREVFPLASVGQHLVHFGLALLVFYPFVWMHEDSLRTVHLLYLPLVALFVVFTVGACLVLSPLSVLYRDLRHLTESAMLLLFWVTPIVYSTSLVPASLQPWFRMNPVGQFMAVFHDVLYWNRLPDVHQIAGLGVWAFLAVGFGAVLFHRVDPVLAEEV
jgi:ABC-type polysaccharide/polyol phosphate export permease